MLLHDTILQNRYRIVRKLGQGGMGTVYEALDQRLKGRIVAVKEMMGRRDDEARNAFEREAALLANLDHPNLPKVTDYFSENDGDFLVMQFIRGMDLDEWLDLRGRRFPQAQVLDWADDLLGVLEYLHGHNPPILHRDIKPSNIKCTEQSRIFLLDFGLAKGAFGQMHTDGSSPSRPVGTLFYASIEQLQGSRTDGRSDLYSLAATLNHLISGVTPVDAGSRYQAVEDELPDPMASLADFASPKVASVIDKAMAIGRTQRFSNATEFRRALRQAADEDQQSTMQEEYRRAEDRRRHREEDKRKAGEEEAKQSEWRQIQEAETRRKEAPQRQESVALHHEGRRVESADQASEAQLEDVHFTAEENAKPASGNPPSTFPPPELSTEFPESSDKVDIPRAIIALAPQSQPEHLNHEDAASVAEETAPTKGVSLRRAFVGVVALIMVVGGVFFWRQKVAPRDLTGPSQTRSEATSPPNVTEKQSPPKSNHPRGMVHVHGGAFTMGRDDGDEYERPAHKVTVASFYIDLYEVTREDYQNCVDENKCDPPSTWRGNRFPAGTNRLPVTGVTWKQANAYATWTGKRLPTEEEWEFAARGGIREFRYPWGNEWKSGSANANSAATGLAEVGTYKGTSTFGAFDMVGNAWEWTASPLQSYGRGKSKIALGISYGFKDLKIIRGCMYGCNKHQATTTHRRGWPADAKVSYENTGFRCAKDAPQ
ncbi:MAG TPA: SUMF1/EgtB/PvdO family nonheme iron enzyme [Pyrinomonadaceae bacterium]|nr:SUMF1/EgtB/PvdO family nonheme iron enzyme [Pyrinomonadaceae bacterium]